MESPEKQIRLENFKSAENGVIVLGFAKSGSHLMLSILDELGQSLKISKRNFV